VKGNLAAIISIGVIGGVIEGVILRSVSPRGHAHLIVSVVCGAVDAAVIVVFIARRNARRRGSSEEGGRQ
jgi:hypothetical protein